MKKLLFFIIFFSVIIITGCSSAKPGIPSNEEPDDAESENSVLQDLFSFDGKIRVLKDKVWNYMDKSGKITGPCSPFDFMTNPVSYAGYGLFKIYDSHGTVLYQGNFEWFSYLDYDYYVYYDKLTSPTNDGTGNLCGLMNDKYEKVTPAIYQLIQQFDGETMIVKKDGKYGTINKSGQPVIECKYGEMYRLPNGYYSVKDPVTNKYGFMNPEGELLIPYQYDNYERDSIGDQIIVAKKVTDGFQHYAIDLMGNIVLQSPFINSFYNPNSFFYQTKYGYIVSDIDNHYYFYNRDGDRIFDQPFFLIMAVQNSRNILCMTNEGYLKVYSVDGTLQTESTPYGKGFHYLYDLNHIENFYFYKNSNIIYQGRSYEMPLNLMPDKVIDGKVLVYDSRYMKAIMTIDGRIVIPPEYSRIDPYRDGYFVLHKKVVIDTTQDPVEFLGVADQNGNIIVDCIYDAINYPYTYVS